MSKKTKIALIVVFGMVVVMLFIGRGAIFG